jgi:hypothetical protein
MFSLLGWFAPKAVKSFLNIERTSHIGIVPEARRAAFAPVYCIEKRYSDGGGGIWTPIVRRWKLQRRGGAIMYYVEVPKLPKSLALNAVARTRAGVTDVTVDRFQVSSSIESASIFLLRPRCLAFTALL